MCAKNVNVLFFLPKNIPNPKNWKVTQSGNLGSIRGLRQKKKQPRGFVDQTDEEEDMDKNENEVGDDPDEPEKDVNFSSDSNGFGMRVELDN